MDIINEISPLSFPHDKPSFVLNGMWVIWYMYADTVNILSYTVLYLVLFTQHLGFRAQGLIFLAE